MHGIDEGALVRRAATGLAATVLPTQIGAVDLRAPAELAGLLALAHYLHDFGLHRPGGGIGNAEVALELQRGGIVLGMRDQVHGHKPSRQRRLAGLEDRACDQTVLETATAALEVQPGAPAKLDVLGEG